jgi:predicted dehydrogenase
MNEKIRIGMIGVNPERGWASAAHFPALALLPQYEVTALSTTRPASAGRAAGPKMMVGINNRQIRFNHGFDRAAR